MNKWLTMIVILTLATVSNAAISGYFDGGTEVTLPTAGTDVVVNKMLIDVSDGHDWTNAYLHIELSAGSFYEEIAFGTDTEPNPALLGIFPDLAYDSYLDTPGPYSTADLASFAPGKTITPTVYDVSWFDDPNYPDGPGVFQIAQFTLTPDAWGTGYAVVFDTETTGHGVEIPIVVWEGIINFPEPATLILLAAGMTLILRKRRR